MISLILFVLAVITAVTGNFVSDSIFINFSSFEITVMLLLAAIYFKIED